MDSIEIRIETRNAAFDEDHAESEVARILRYLARRLQDGVRPTKLMDYYGNHVGDVTFDED